jgi:hypothetical protein
MRHLRSICTAFWDAAQTGLRGDQLFESVRNAFPDCHRYLVVRAAFRAAADGRRGSDEELLAIYDAALRARVISNMTFGDD